MRNSKERKKRYGGRIYLHAILPSTPCEVHDQAAVNQDRSHGSQLPYLTKVINTLTGLLSLRMYFCASTIQSTLRQLRIYFIVRIHTTIFYHKYSELLGHFNMISCSYDETNWSQK